MHRSSSSSSSAASSSADSETLKYNVIIRYEHGAEVTPRYQTGSSVEHFAACVHICLDLLGQGALSTGQEHQSLNS
ncbi:hypothetical protein BH10PSE19_BH10PSE19_15660 [soil metagenome]